MFVRSAFVALFLITALLSLNVEAQLLRFGRSRDGGQPRYAQPQYQVRPQIQGQFQRPQGQFQRPQAQLQPQTQLQRAATAYDASAYRYTQPQQTASYIPSQRQPSCGCANGGSQQVANPAARAQQQSRLVVATYRDPYTGRTMQRQYLVQGTVQQGQPQRTVQIPPPMVMTQTAPQSQFVSPPATATTSQAASTNLASPIAASAVTEGPNAGGVRQTSFDGDEIAPLESNGQFSVLETDGVSDSQPASVFDSSSPELELQSPGNSSDPGELEIETNGTIDFDLPALDPEK